MWCKYRWFINDENESDTDQDVPLSSDFDADIEMIRDQVLVSLIATKVPLNMTALLVTVTGKRAPRGNKGSLPILYQN